MTKTALNSSELFLDTVELLGQTEFDAPKCLVGTNFLEYDEAAGRSHLDHLYVNRRRKAPAVHLRTLPADAVLAVPNEEEFIPVTKDYVLSDQVRPSWTSADIDAALTKCQETIAIPREAVLIARYGIRTWGHWLGELLPKLVCVEAAFPKRFNYVMPASIASDPALTSTRESLEAYGIQKDRLLYVQAGCLYRFPLLHVVSPVWSADHAIHPGAIDAMRSILPQDDDLESVPAKTAFLRRESPTRKVKNIDSVCAYLETRGWTVVDVGNLRFIDQVRVFAGARHILSVLGSGLTGLIYARRGVDVLTLAPNNWSDLFFFAIMQNRGANLVDIRGMSDAANRRDAAWAPFEVDIDAIAYGLRALGLTAEPLAEDGARKTEFQTSAERPDIALERAALSRRRGEFEAAEEIIRSALQAAPDEAALQAALVQTLLDAGRIDEAESVGREALSRADQGAFVAAFRALQDALASAAQPERALEWAQRETSASPRDAEAFSRLGHLLSRLSNHAQAADAFARAAALRPDDPGLHIAHAVSLLQAGRTEDAIGATARAHDVAPYHPLAKRLLGDALARSGRTEQAEAAYLEALAAAPEDIDVLWRLVKLYEASERPDVALTFADRLVALVPASSAAHSQRGHLLARTGSVGEAAAAFRQALAGDNSNAGLHEALAHTLGRLERFADGAVAAQHAVAAAPDEPRFLITLSQMLRYSGDLDGAVRALEAAAALQPDDAALSAELERVRAEAALAPRQPDPPIMRRVRTSLPLVRVEVRQDAADTVGSLSVVPWLVALAERHGSMVLVNGLFDSAVEPLLSELPLTFEASDESPPLITYRADVADARDYAVRRGMHICQGYFEMAGMPIPNLPIGVALRGGSRHFAPGIVISPSGIANGAERADRLTASEADWWHAAIRRLQACSGGGPIYLVNARTDDLSSQLGIGVESLPERPLGEVLTLLRGASLFISMNTDLALLAHLCGIRRHLVIDREAERAMAARMNPHAKSLHVPLTEAAVEALVGEALLLLSAA